MKKKIDENTEEERFQKVYFYVKHFPSIHRYILYKCLNTWIIHFRIEEHTTHRLQAI